LQPDRQWGLGSYRYGFNGKENDNEVKGEGNQQDYGMRVYDPRLGKFLSVDPLRADYPWNSTYAFAENDVIRSIDLDGLEKMLVIYEKVLNSGKLTITRVASRDNKVQNLEIQFSDGTLNDQNQAVLRIQNGFEFNRKKPDIQENDKELNAFEKFVVAGNTTAKRNEAVQATVEDNGSVVGKGKEFSRDGYVMGESVGYVSGISFNWNGIKSVDQQIGIQLGELKHISGIENPKVYIQIGTPYPLDKQVISSYEELLKNKYGSEIKLEWFTRTKKTPSEANTNVSIAIKK
jgi:RHS repeat-associated protein